MNITYKYTVISADESARCMEIMYEAHGHQTMYIGARLPYEGETLEEVVKMYAPLALWETAVRSVTVPTAGTTGVIELDKLLDKPLVITAEMQPTTFGTQTL